MRLAMLGAGFIADFYLQALQGMRSRDRVVVIQSRTEESAKALAARFGVGATTTSVEEAVARDDVDAVIIGLPNHLHESAVLATVAAGKPVLCTKPLGRNAAEATRMLRAVEQAGLWNAYLEDLVYTPKTLKSLEAVRQGAIGDVLWVRSRETHPGPHSDWFWNREKAGGGALIDMGCHCIEIGRNFIGKTIRPVEVICWADTQVHPIEVEDHAIGMVRYENGAVGQFEVSWCFRGGMDLRDEVAGTEGTLWLNHWLRTGLEMYSSGQQAGYVAEKSESAEGWLFPVGDEPAALGYREMFVDALNALEQGRSPRETFYDGYVVNAIMDSAYRSHHSRKWEPVELTDWRGETAVRRLSAFRDYDSEHWLIKRETMPNGDRKVILKHKQTGEVSSRRESSDV